MQCVCLNNVKVNYLHVYIVGFITIIQSMHTMNSWAHQYKKYDNVYEIIVHASYKNTNVNHINLLEHYSYVLENVIICKIHKFVYDNLLLLHV